MKKLLILLTLLVVSTTVSDESGSRERNGVSHEVQAYTYAVVRPSPRGW